MRETGSVFSLASANRPLPHLQFPPPPLSPLRVGPDSSLCLGNNPGGHRIVCFAGLEQPFLNARRLDPSQLLDPPDFEILLRLLERGQELFKFLIRNGALDFAGRRQLDDLIFD